MVEFAGGATLHTYLTVIRRRKWWLIAVALLGLAASLGLSLTEPKQYSATAQLLVQASGQSITLGSAAQQVTTTDVQTELQLATSAPVLHAVQRTLRSTPPIMANEVAQTNVIGLTAVSSSPARAAVVANTYAKAFVAQTRSTAISSLSAAQSQLLSEISTLGRQIKSLQGKPAKTAQVAALINQQAVLKEEVAQLQINGAAATSAVEFVTPAQPPTAPSSPRPARDALLGLAIGLLLGLGAAFLRDNLDDALTSKEAAERIGGAPVLAMVPMVNSWRKRGRPVIASSSEPTSAAAEAYRSLRTSLQFARQAHDMRTLLVTSPAAAEGKTSTLANLGAVFAQAGERVVLVSCDLRRPRLGQFFQVDEQSGLTTVLLGRQTLEQAVQPVHGYDCLWMLAAGPVPPNPAELLNSSRAKEVFAALAASFDLVLVDSPPVLPVTDAMVLSQYADGTLVVVAAGQTRKAELQRATERFAQAKSSLVGLVLNEVTRQSIDGRGYGETYGYGSYQPDQSLGSIPAQTNGYPDAPDPLPGTHGH